MVIVSAAAATPSELSRSSGTPTTPSCLIASGRLAAAKTRHPSRGNRSTSRRADTARRAVTTIGLDDREQKHSANVSVGNSLGLDSEWNLSITLCRP
jgi:hypothetical protein